jgi:hypothetical protein
MIKLLPFLLIVLTAKVSLCLNSILQELEQQPHRGLISQ